jgi:hypothetical protein
MLGGRAPASLHGSGCPFSYKSDPDGAPHGATFSDGLGFCSITASLMSHLQRAGLGLKVFNAAAPDNNKNRRWFAKATNRAITEIASKMKSKLSATASMMFAMSTSETLLSFIDFALER